jgi:hypothetical protein
MIVRTQQVLALSGCSMVMGHVVMENDKVRINVPEGLLSSASVFSLQIFDAMALPTQPAATPTTASGSTAHGVPTLTVSADPVALYSLFEPGQDCFFVLGGHASVSFHFTLHTNHALPRYSPANADGNGDNIDNASSNTKKRRSSTRESAT